MSVSDFFKKLFGIPPRNPTFNDQYEEPVHRFRSPIWGDDEDDSEDEFRNTPTTPFGFQIFTGDPMDMHRYFEQQFDEMLKSFKAMEGKMFGSDLLELPEGVRPTPGSEESIRDRYLKPSYERAAIDGLGGRKLDSDIDDRVGAGGGDVGALLGPSLSPEVPRRAFESRSRSVVSKTIRLPDGRVEESRTVKGSDGEERTTVTRRLGDQSVTVTTIRSGEGTTRKEEELVNIDQGDLADFESKWKAGAAGGRGLPPHNEAPPTSGLLSILDKLFNN